VTAHHKNQRLTARVADLAVSHCDANCDVTDVRAMVLVESQDKARATEQLIKQRLPAMLAHAWGCLDVDQQRILTGLPALSRDAYCLAVVWEYTEAETAVLLDSSQSTVSRALISAKQQIRETLSMPARLPR
jgi:DNA-directed RNA polymerase specialized sigma24 family protein